jgi:hypothetical protein
VVFVAAGLVACAVGAGAAAGITELVVPSGDAPAVSGVVVSGKPNGFATVARAPPPLPRSPPAFEPLFDPLFPVPERLRFGVFGPIAVGTVLVGMVVVGVPVCPVPGVMTTPPGPEEPVERPDWEARQATPQPVTSAEPPLPRALPPITPPAPELELEPSPAPLPRP